MDYQVLQNFNRVYFHCQYANHEDQLILGFCLNADCKQVSQFCFLCSKESHKSHPDDLIIFKNISMMLVDAKAIMKRNQQDNDYLDYLWSDCEKMQKNINQKRFEQFQQKTKFFRKNLQIIQIFTIKADQYLDKCIQAIKDQDFVFIKKQIRIFKKINLYKNDLNKTKQLKLLYEKLDQYKSSLHQNYEYLLCRFNSQIRQQRIPVKKTINKAIKIVEVNENSIPIDINFYITQGQELLKIKNYQQVLINFNNAISLNPQCYEAYLNKGHTLFKLKQYKEALQSYDMVPVEEQKKVFFLINKGCALLKLYSNKEAIEFFDEALKLDPIDSKIYFYKGKALLQKNLIQEAIDQFTIANDIKPCPKYQMKISQALFNNCQSNFALQYVENILKIEPNNHKAINIKDCVCLREQKKFKEALQQFDEAIRIENKKPNYHRNKGWCLQDMGKYQEAIELYKVTLVLNQGDCLANFLYGFSLYQLNKFSEAQKYLTISKQINPKIDSLFKNKDKNLVQNHREIFKIKQKNLFDILKVKQFNFLIIPQFQIQKSNALLHLNKHQEALQYYDGAINLFDQNYNYYFYRGLLLIELKKYKESMDSFNQALQLHSKNPEIYIIKCHPLRKLKRFNEAVACMDNAIQLDQNNFKYYLQKGDILFESKRIDEAVQCYTQALKLNPQYEEELIKKGDDLVEEKEYMEAWNYYERVIQFNPKNKSVIKKRDEITLPAIEQGTNKIGEEFKSIKNQFKESWNEFLENL